MASPPEFDQGHERQQRSNLEVLWERFRPRARTQTKTPGAIVLGGDYRGLAVVRSLGRHGIPVWVFTDEHTVAGTSRYAVQTSSLPDSDREQVSLLQDLALERGVEGWVVFPTGDRTAAMLSRNHAYLDGRLRLTVPEWSVFMWAHDKRRTYELARSLGLACPWTRYLQDDAEVENLDCLFPVILKPATKEALNRFTQEKVWLAPDRETLLKRYREARALVPAEEVMIQEFIPGEGDSQLAFAALCEAGEPLASIVVRRARQYPRDFGLSSSFVESVECREVEDAARRLLKAMRYTGLVEVEFKYDSREMSFKLLDVNPRVWGWHSLGRRAGVDFPYLGWQHSQGMPVDRIRGRTGVRWVRAVTDIPAVAAEMRAGTLSPAEYLKSLQGPVEYAIWAPDDPLPALLEVPLLARLAWKRRRSHQW